MEPIDELTQSLVSLLESLAERKNEFGDAGRKDLLDTLRRFSVHTEKLNRQLISQTGQIKGHEKTRVLYLVRQI